MKKTVFPAKPDTHEKVKFESSTDLFFICCLLNNCGGDFPSPRQGNSASRTIQFAQKVSKIKMQAPPRKVLARGESQIELLQRQRRMKVA